jgi:hypothetical protein
MVEFAFSLLEDKACFTDSCISEHSDFKRPLEDA